MTAQYIVHHGYFECDGLEMFETLNEVRIFIEKKSKQGDEYSTFFRIYKVKNIDRISLEDIMGR